MAVQGLTNRMVVVFPDKSRQFLATVVSEDEEFVTVMTRTEEIYHLTSDQIRDATREDYMELANK